MDNCSCLLDNSRVSELSWCLVFGHPKAVSYGVGELSVFYVSCFLKPFNREVFIKSGNEVCQMLIKVL